MTEEATEGRPFLTDFEWRVLRSFDNGDKINWGAAVSVALESLVGVGYLRGNAVVGWELTSLGRERLREAENYE